MRLLVDIGNSRLKWALSDHAFWHVGSALNYRDHDFPRTLRCTWQQISPAPKEVLIACVGSSPVRAIIERCVLVLWQCPTRLIQSQDQTLGLTSGYRQPATLGVDRWLALLAATAFYPSQALCVADFGTAITVDLLDGNQRHLGGVIAPGLALMLNSLHAGTCGLPGSHAEFGSQLAENTQQGMANGVLLAAIGLVEQVMIRHAGLEPRLLITGGDGALAASFLETPCEVIPDLVLQGLRVLGESDA